MMERKYKSREETRNINKKLRKTSEKTTKQKWQTETQGKRNNGDKDKQKTKDKRAILNPHLSAIILNITKSS